MYSWESLKSELWHLHDPAHLPALGLALLPGGVDHVVIQDPDEGVAAGLEAALSLSDAVFT